MRKYIIPFKDTSLKVHVSKDNTCILDSYTIEKKSDMKEVLNMIREKAPKNSAIHKRSINGMIKEWRSHNLLYSLGVQKERTKDVDLELNQSWYKKITYFILSPLYF